MSYQQMHFTRSKLIDSLTGLSPIYVMSLYISDMHQLGFWRYVIGTAGWVILAGLYNAIFKRFVCPKNTDNREIKSSRKYLYYIGIFAIIFAVIIFFSVLPFRFYTNLVISLVVNFLLTMMYCYYIAKEPKA